VHIHRLDPSAAADADLGPAAAILGAAEGERRGLPPVPAGVVLSRLRCPEATADRHVLVAGDPADPDGAAVVDIERGPENAHVANMQVAVAAERRRRGVGGALVECAAADVVAAGRTLLISSSESLAPAGLPFAEALGFEAGLVMRVNRLDLADLDLGLVDAWIAAASPAYELVHVDGRVPDDLMDTFLATVDAMNDAPTDDLDVEDERTTPARVRANEARVAATGGRALLLVARHRETGAGAGFTNIRWWPHHPTVLYQGGTATHREHRGHGLGRWMKAAMLRWAMAEIPTIEEVRTENAHTNPHMLAINDALGFHLHAEETIHQRRLA
jgi:mycothiol synthase